MLQDHLGFLWFGSRDGLNKFDGHRFTVYRWDPDDASSLSSNHIYALYEDTRGNLWVGSGKGLNRFDRDRERFVRYQHDPNDPKSLSHDHIVAVSEDGEGRIWAGSLGGGLNRLDADQQGVFESYSQDSDNPFSLNSSWVRSMRLDRRGVLWIGTNWGLARWDAEQGRFERYIPFPEKGQRDNRVLAIFEDRSDVLWVAVSSRLMRFDRDTGRFHPGSRSIDETSPTFEIRAIDEDSDGMLWLGAQDGGLYRVDVNEETTTRFAHDRLDAYSLSHNSVLAILLDRSDVLWIGTEGGGLNKLNRTALTFGRRRLTSALNLDAEPKILGFRQDRRGRFWIAADMGLYVFDETWRFLRRYGRETFGDEWIWTLQEDREGGMWVGVLTNGLFHIKANLDRDPITAYRHDPDKPDSLSYDGVTCLLEDRQGRIWAGAAGAGLNRLDRARQAFTRFQHDPSRPCSLSNDIVSALYEARNGRIWVGTFGGLNVWDPDSSDCFTQFVHQPNQPDSISLNQVRCILEDRQGAIWVGTEGGGLNRLDVQTGRFRRYQVPDGMPSNAVCGILEDDRGLLWISTYRGLARLDPATDAIRIFGSLDGLQGNEFSPGAAYLSADGHMFFGGSAGFNVFNPRLFPTNTAKSPTAITDFLLFNQSVKPGEGSILPAAIHRASEIRLNHRQNVFAFEFSLLDYANSSQNQYAYILENRDADWTRTDAERRFAVYTHLAAGSYRFKVKGGNPDGVWGPESSVRVVVLPPPWKTWQAYTVYALIAATLAYLYLRLQRKKLAAERAINESLEIKVSERTKSLASKNEAFLRQQKKLERQALHLRDLDRLKTRFFTNISHEFRTPLMLTLGPLEDYMAAGKGEPPSPQDLTLMHRNAFRLRKLIDELLDLSTLEAGQMSLDPRPVDAAVFVRRCAEPFQALAARRGVALTVNGQESLAASWDCDKLEKVIHNLLSNAFKFTDPGGKIMIKLAPDADRIRIHVKDTGAGIPKDQLPYIFDRFFHTEPGSNLGASSGVGLALAKEIVELHQGRIEVRSEQGFGSEFTLDLPRGDADSSLSRPFPVDAKAADPMAVDAWMDDDSLAAPEPDPTDKSAESQERRDTVLIVEDNADVRAYIKSRLQPSYRLIEAIDGRTGLELARDHMPDLVVTDIMMPGVDGYALCQALKTGEMTSHIPVIMLTAKSTVDQQLSGFQSGADDYLVKPFNARILLGRIQNLIEGRRLLRERFSRQMVLKPRDISVSSADQAFIQKVMAALEAHYQDSRFGVLEWAEELGLSRRQLHRKITALTGQTPVELLRKYRLDRAAQLLRAKAGNIAEIAYAVGFNHPHRFSAQFQKAFGQKPKDYGRDI